MLSESDTIVRKEDTHFGGLNKEANFHKCITTTTSGYNDSRQSPNLSSSSNALGMISKNRKKIKSNSKISDFSFGKE